MNRKGALILLIAAAFLLVSAPALLAEQEVEVGNARMIDLPRDARVGDVMLARGQYRVRHLQRGDEHIMVFETPRRKEVVRVPCTMEKLPRKASGPEYRYRRNQAGEYVLMHMVFGGDDVLHRF